jgi:hypothetical protein
MKNLYKILVVSALVFSLFAVKVSFAAEPTVMTDPATNITTSSATLSAFYNANGETITGAMFKYGTDPLMSQTAYVSTPTSASGTLSTTISGLLPNTTYYFKTVLVSTYGMTQGYSAPFKTLSLPVNEVCSVNSFNSNVGAVPAGNSVVLSWNTTNCNNVTITPNGVSSILASGSTTVTVNSTTTYTITAYGNTNNDTKTLTVTVTTPTPTSCVINSFSASPSNIDFSYNYSTPVTLSWNTSNCSYVNLGQSGGGSYSATGSTVVYVNAPTTYTLYAYGTNNNDTETVNITSGGSNTGTCSITSFTSSKTSVYAGDRVTLYWNTRNCTHVGFGNGYGYQTSGSAPVTINTTSRFTINAYGSNGDDTDTITIRVIDNGCGAYTCDYDEPACTSNCNNNNNNYPWYSPCNWVGCAVTAQAQTPVVTNPQVVYYQTPVTNQVASSQNSSGTTNTRSTTNVSKSVYDTNENSKLITGTSVDENTMQGNNLSASAGSSGWSFLPNTLLGWLFFVIFILLIVFISRKFAKSSSADSHGHGH